MIKEQKSGIRLLSNLVSEIVSSSADDCLFEYSIYNYQPQTFGDPREVKRVSLASLYDSLMEDYNSLGDGKEIAFHSKVWVKNEPFHIPLVDFSCKSISLIHKVYVKSGMETEIGPLFVFHSGRSFHAYGVKLFRESDWVRFMGGLLLLNPPASNEFVDSRWVGHRLRGGYSSLRWTANSEWYLKQPSPMALIGSEVRNLTKGLSRIEVRDLLSHYGEVV